MNVEFLYAAMFLFFLIFIAFLLFRLWSVLGTQSKMNPCNPSEESNKKHIFRPSTGPKTLENVTYLPQVLPGIEAEIVKSLPDFNGVQFLKMCENIFLETIEAFQNSHHQVLKQHLSPLVYESFSKQIERREDQKLTLEFEVRNLSSEILDFVVHLKKLKVRVQLTNEQMSLTHDSQGNSFDNPAKIFVPKINIWTFQKSLSNPTSSWTVTEITEQKI